MQNLNINNEQISASSWLEGFSPSQARPYNTGWCPMFDDREAHIRVCACRCTSVIVSVIETVAVISLFCKSQLNFFENVHVYL